MGLPKNQPLHREQISPVASEQRKDEQEREAPEPGVGGWTSQQPVNERIDTNVAKPGDETAGRPTGDHGTRKTLIGAGTSTAGDGSADGGLNSDEPPQPKSKSKL